MLMEMISPEMVRHFTQLKGCKQFQNVLSTIHLHPHRTTLDHRFQIYDMSGLDIQEVN